MVAAANRRFFDPQRIRRLCDVGRIPKRALHVRPVSVAVLFAGDFWRSEDGVVRGEAWMVAGAAAVFTGADHSAVSGTVPVHVLLLSRRVLQGVLGGSDELRGRRAAEELSRREDVSADSP